jgi:hypothetical protein
MARNLVVQGYCLSGQERKRLRLGLRFSTGACVALAGLALALQSAPLLVTLSVIGGVAGLAPRHPFDLLWNHGVRHAFGAPPLPLTPARRRHAFKLGAVWLLAVAILFATGLSIAARALGGILLAACGLVTTTNFCLPSFLLSLLDLPRGAPTTHACLASSIAKGESR